MEFKQTTIAIKIIRRIADVLGSLLTNPLLCHKMKGCRIKTWISIIQIIKNRNGFLKNQELSLLKSHIMCL
jgi:hypothetical protein